MIFTNIDGLAKNSTLPIIDLFMTMQTLVIGMYHENYEYNNLVINNTKIR